MSDLISRQAAIDTVKRLMIHDTPEQAAEIWNRMVVVVEKRRQHEP